MWYICVREFWAAHLQPLKPESDLLCVLGEVLGAFRGTAASDGQSQLSLWADALGQLSQDTQARGGGQLCTLLRHQHGPKQGMYTWPLLVTNHHCCRDMEPDMILCGSMGQYLTMALCGTTDYSYQAIYHYP